MPTIALWKTYSIRPFCGVSVHTRYDFLLLTYASRVGMLQSYVSFLYHMLYRPLFHSHACPCSSVVQFYILSFSFPYTLGVVAFDTYTALLFRVIGVYIQYGNSLEHNSHPMNINRLCMSDGTDSHNLSYSEKMCFKT